MTALQEAIEHFKISNSQSAYSNTQIVYILEQFLAKEKSQIMKANLDGFIEGTMDDRVKSSEDYFNENYKNK